MANKIYINATKKHYFDNFNKKIWGEPQTHPISGGKPIPTPDPIMVFSHSRQLITEPWQL